MQASNQSLKKHNLYGSRDYLDLGHSEYQLTAWNKNQ